MGKAETVCMKVLSAQTVGWQQLSTGPGGV
jgi:hypothetical protein